MVNSKREVLKRNCELRRPKEGSWDGVFGEKGHLRGTSGSLGIMSAAEIGGGGRVGKESPGKPIRKKESRTKATKQRGLKREG